MQDIVNYIIGFLINDDSKNYSSIVGYTNNPVDFEKYKLVIFQSDFFNHDVYGSSRSLPTFPLKNKHKGTPVLFGEDRVEKKNDTLILYADIIASSYFLISRYEETVRSSERDMYGRFPGKNSILAKNQLIDRPLVDEYGRILRDYLRELGVDIKEPKDKLNKIYLTHDVDAIAHYRNLRSLGGALLRSYKSPKEAVAALKTYFGKIDEDPWFTFPFFFEQKNILSSNLKVDIDQIAFVKPGGGREREDKPISNVFSSDFQHLFNLFDENDVKIGLHLSYKGAENPFLPAEEKKMLEKALNKNINLHRNHYLRSKEPEDMQHLINAGITDDFTMTYADLAGFRLGTSRSIRWIDPVKIELTSLVLHPLTVMDGTLSNEKYMSLTEDAAYRYCLKLIEETKKHNGDLCLLWHNTSIENRPDTYHRNLYKRIIKHLSENN